MLLSQLHDNQAAYIPTYVLSLKNNQMVASYSCLTCRALILILLQVASWLASRPTKKNCSIYLINTIYNVAIYTYYRLLANSLRAGPTHAHAHIHTHMYICTHTNTYTIMSTHMHILSQSLMFVDKSSFKKSRTCLDSGSIFTAAVTSIIKVCSLWISMCSITTYDEMKTSCTSLHYTVTCAHTISNWLTHD